MSACPVCGDGSEQATVAMDEARIRGPDFSDAATCERCAERIANLFWRLRSGRWLTYDNAPALRRPTKAVIPHHLRQAVYERDLYRCRHCGTHLDLTIDHVIAESLGGPTTFENLQTLCRPCNSMKGTRT